MTTQIELIADLLMGAAYADNHLDGREYEVVKKLLATAMKLDTIPKNLEQRIKSFDSSAFDPVVTAKSLDLTDDEQKRGLIQLVSAVTDADDVLDLDENAYIELVAETLEMPRASYSDLTVEILSVESLQAAGKKVTKPPPIPSDAK